MMTVFLTDNIWPQLTQTVLASPDRCTVAVAYFGAGASRLLPLQEGSRLVVDASEHAVASGQTCPADLASLVKRHVRVFSVPNLHAKVFVIGRTAYVGSANASANAASRLVEAVIRTTDPVTVRAVRQFVHDQCLHELSPKLLKHLATIYRPPQIPGGKPDSRTPKARSPRPALPRLFLAQIHTNTFSEAENAVLAAGLPIAQKQRAHPRSFILDEAMVTGTCRYRVGDVIIQVNHETADQVLVAPPGNVVHTQEGQEGRLKKTCVYIERPDRRRRRLATVARTLGKGSKKKLQKTGLIRDRTFAQTILNAWAH